MEVQLPIHIEGQFLGQCLTVVRWQKGDETKLRGQQATSFLCQMVVLSSYLQKLKLLSSSVHLKSLTLSDLPPNVLSRTFQGSFFLCLESVSVKPQFLWELLCQLLC